MAGAVDMVGTVGEEAIAAGIEVGQFIGMAGETAVSTAVVVAAAVWGSNLAAAEVVGTSLVAAAETAVLAPVVVAEVEALV
jgi:hypothetical protein